jgi:hypothetical protein
LLLGLLHPLLGRLLQALALLLGLTGEVSAGGIEEPCVSLHELLDHLLGVLLLFLDLPRQALHQVELLLGALRCPRAHSLHIVGHRKPSEKSQEAPN